MTRCWGQGTESGIVVVQPFPPPRPAPACNRPRTRKGRGRQNPECQPGGPLRLSLRPAPEFGLARYGPRPPASRRRSGRTKPASPTGPPPGRDEAAGGAQRGPGMVLRGRSGESASDNEQGRARRSSREGLGALLTRARRRRQRRRSPAQPRKLEQVRQHGAGGRTPAVRAAGAGAGRGGAGPGARRGPVAEKGARHFPAPPSAPARLGPPRALPSTLRSGPARRDPPRLLPGAPHPAPPILLARPSPIHAAAKAAGPVPGPPLGPAWGGAGGRGAASVRPSRGCAAQAFPDTSWG